MNTVLAEGFDVASVRRDFPILATRVHGKPLVYLDSAATSQKPTRVIEAVTRYYTETNANVHRGVYDLSVRATAAYEGARETVARFLNASASDEIVFVRGTTEALNLVAQSFVRPRLAQGDEVLITEMEHHSNIVPWQLVVEATGAKLRVCPIDDDGELELDRLYELMGPKTRVLALTHVSNALGTVNPIRRITEKAHARGIPVVVDGAQGVVHRPVDVRELGVDFYAFSGHKLYGPTGAGALYGKREHLEAMGPYQGGGEMIRRVTFEKTTYNDVPHRFEAGTPNVAGVVGMAAAIDYVASIGVEPIARYNDALLAHAEARLREVPGLVLVGTAREKAGVASFVLEGVHPHDAGTILDREGIAVRTGHHCAQPVMDRYHLPATIRASMTFYNTTGDIDALVAGLGVVRKVFPK